MNAVKRFDGKTILFHIYITIAYIFIWGAYATRRSDNGIVAMSSLPSSTMTLSSSTVRVA